jgi:hypothetical protein
MADPTPDAGLSPLDQIRLAESEITRKIITAREACESAVAEERLHANLLKKQAHESGIRAGLIRHEEIVSQAEEEARGMVQHARSQADELRRKGQARREEAIREALDIVLGVKGSEISDES